MNQSPEQNKETLERLLDPTGYQVSCEQCFELLDQYVELELLAATRQLRAEEVLFWPLELPSATRAERPGIYLHPDSFQGTRIHTGDSLSITSKPA